MSKDAPTSVAEKPLLYPDERADAEKFDPNLHRGHLDPSRIPGYSEVVQANDIEKADALLFRDRNGTTKEDVYRQIGATPRPLPVEFAWLPISGVGGAPSNAQERVADRYKTQEGFRLAIWPDDFEPHGFDFPPLGRHAEDGTIRRGADTALFVRSGEVARKWDAFKAREQAEFEGRSASPSISGPEGYFGKEDSESRVITH